MKPRPSSSLSRGEVAIMGACAYLAALFLSVVCLWWVAIVGGNPFRVVNLAVVNWAGAPSDHFRTGDAVGIKRRFCADSQTAIEFFPAIMDAKGALYPLPHGMVVIPSGCTETMYGFVVPPVPPGDYTYVSTVKYQKNLVGRDEQTALPHLRLRVIRDRLPDDATASGSGAE